MNYIDVKYQSRTRLDTVNRNNKLKYYLEIIKTK